MTALGASDYRINYHVCTHYLRLSLIRQDRINGPFGYGGTRRAAYLEWLLLAYSVEKLDVIHNDLSAKLSI